MRFGGEQIPRLGPDPRIRGREYGWNSDFPNFDPQGKDRREVIKDNATDADWQRLRDAATEINSENHRYRWLGPNSNTGADEAICRAGLPSPKDDIAAPGSGVDLPGGANCTDPTQQEHPIDKIFRRFREMFDRPKNVSPIVLDLDGDGVETAAISSVAYFDHNADDFAERTGWVRGGDGLLVWDRNGDGRISSGRELFGNQTLLANGTLALTGFDALAELDTVRDGKIDASDVAAWANPAGLEGHERRSNGGCKRAADPVGDGNTVYRHRVLGFQLRRPARQRAQADRDFHQDERHHGHRGRRLVQNRSDVHGR